MAASVSDGLCWVGADRRIVFVNPAMAGFAGSDQASLVGAPASECLGGELRAVLDMILEHVAGGQTINQTLELKQPEWRVLRLVARPADSRGAALLIFSDTSSRTELRRALRRENDRLNDFAEIAADWFWEMDAELRFSYFSGRVEECLGIKPEQVLGRTRVDLFDAAEPLESRRSHEADLRARRPFRNFRYRLGLPNGESRVIEISGNPVFHEQGGFAGYRGTGRDLTESLAARHETETLRARLADAMESITEGLILWDAEDRLVLCNTPYRQSLGPLGALLHPGMSFEALLRARLEQGLVDLGDQDAEAWVRERIDRHRRYLKGAQCRTPDGRWIETNEYRTSEGGTLTLRTDITQRVLAEQALLGSEARFERAVQGSRAGIWDQDLVTGHLYLSPGFKHLLGYADDELMDFSFAEWLHPDDREAILQAMRQCAEAGDLFDAEFRLPHKNGDYRWLHGRGQSFVSDDGQARYFAGAIADATERKKAEEALAASEALFRTMFTNASVGISLTDPDGRILRYNNEFRRMLGLTESTTSGLRWMDLTHPDDLPMNLRYQQEIKAGVRDHFRYTKRYKRADGSYVWVDASSSALRDDDGQMLYAVNVSSDISERRRAEDQIRYYQEHLEDLVAERTNELRAINREVAAFSYSVSHDLRGPLRAIDGYSQILLDDHAASLGEAGCGYLARMRHASQRMGRLIDDLLMLSRLSRQQINRQALDLGALAQEILGHLRETQGDRDVDFTLSGELCAQGDPGLMRVVLNNLLDNALKYTRRQARASIHLGTVKSTGGKAFYVRDNGVGFDVAYADKLFKAFQRLHADQDFEGTGVGLATVAQIIGRHGGRVWAESQPGQGACFYFSLPEVATAARKRDADNAARIRPL